jgi:uncharacterized protein YjaZ
MEQSLLHSATEEIYHLLQNPNVRYRVHKSPQLVLIMSQMNSVDNIRTYLLSILILSSHLRLGLQSSFFSWGFPTKIFVYIISTCVLHDQTISPSLILSP